MNSEIMCEETYHDVNKYILEPLLGAFMKDFDNMIFIQLIDEYLIDNNHVEVCKIRLNSDHNSLNTNWNSNNFIFSEYFRNNIMNVQMMLNSVYSTDNADYVTEIVDNAIKYVYYVKKSNCKISRNKNPAIIISTKFNHHALGTLTIDITCELFVARKILRFEKFKFDYDTEFMPNPLISINITKNNKKRLNLCYKF